MTTGTADTLRTLTLSIAVIAAALWLAIAATPMPHAQPETRRAICFPCTHAGDRASLSGPDPEQWICTLDRGWMPAPNPKD